MLSESSEMTTTFSLGPSYDGSWSLRSKCDLICEALRDFPLDGYPDIVIKAMVGGWTQRTESIT